MITVEQARALMQRAIVLGERAANVGEVPVGAVISFDGSIIAEAHNEVESSKFVGAHAEMLAISRAGSEVSNWRLSECVICVTLEPCTMCLGAIRLARIPTIIYGTGDPKAGAVGGIYDLSQDARLGPVPRVISGVCEEECRNQLQNFFKERR